MDSSQRRLNGGPAIQRIRLSAAVTVDLQEELREGTIVTHWILTNWWQAYGPAGQSSQRGRDVLPYLVLDSQAEAERRAWAGRQRGQRQTELVGNASRVCDWSQAAGTAPSGGERRVSVKSVFFAPRPI